GVLLPASSSPPYRSSHSRLSMVSAAPCSVPLPHDDPGSRRSGQLGEQSLDLVEGIAGLGRLLGVLEAVGQAAGDQSEPDLFEGLGGGTELGHDVAALASLCQHGLHGLDLASGTLQPLAEVRYHFVRQL